MKRINEVVYYKVKKEPNFANGFAVGIVRGVYTYPKERVEGAATGVVYWIEVNEIGDMITVDEKDLLP